MKILIYRELIGINDFPESFSRFTLENQEVELITISNFDRKETIDKELFDLVREGRKKTPDILVIPVVLGSPLSYYGVRLAMHWRVDESADNLNKIPIILLGDEDEASFFRHCGYSSFLKTPQVFYTQFNEYNLRELIESGSVKNVNFDIRTTLEHYSVKPPASYKSYHSVTNEWCILRWADALKIEDDKISSNRNTIGTSLYYKLLRFKYPISNIDDIKQKILLNKGKIMLIDDEIEKGWKSIFSRICQNQTLISIGDNFKGMKTSEEILNFTMDKVKSEFPDVVILDLRLSDNDFTDNLSPTDLTGYKILEKIKEFNKGIQVIVISATSKIWNLLELQKIGADGFIMKESPDLSQDKQFTKTSISQIYSQIDNCIEKNYLKEVHSKLNPIYEEYTKRILSMKFCDEQNFLIKVASSLDIAFDLLNKGKDDNKYLNLAYITYYQVIEDFANRNDFFERAFDGQCYVLDGSNRIKVIDKTTSKVVWKLKYERGRPNYYEIGDYQYDGPIGSFAKVAFLLVFKFNKNNEHLKKWAQLNDIRNTKAGHGGSNRFVNVKEINELLDEIVIPFMMSI